MMADPVPTVNAPLRVEVPQDKPVPVVTVTGSPAWRIALSDVWPLLVKWGVYVGLLLSLALFHYLEEQGWSKPFASSISAANMLVFSILGKLATNTQVISPQQPPKE